MADILPLKHNLEVYEGDFTELTLTAQMGDITGYTVHLSARLTASSRYAIIESVGEVAEGTEGTYIISFTSSDTLGKATSSGLPYDIVLISPEGKAHTDRTGLLTIDARTTALPPEEVEPEGINIEVGGVLVSEKTPTLDFHAEDVTITDVPATDTAERKTDIKINHHILFEDNEKVDTVYTDAGIKVLLEGDGKATLSQDVTVDPWPYQVLTAFDSVYVLTLNSQMGIDYIVDYKNKDDGLLSIKLETLEPNPPEGHNPTPIKEGSQIRVSLINTTAQSNVVNVFGYHISGTAFNYNVSTPTTFVLRLGEWRIEESSQLLHLSTPHSTKRTPFEDPEVIKTPITGIAVDPRSC